MKSREKHVMNKTCIDLYFLSDKQTLVQDLLAHVVVTVLTKNIC